MSSSDGPVRRRRIAGESAPGQAAKKSAGDKNPTPKAPSVKRAFGRKPDAPKTPKEKPGVTAIPADKHSAKTAPAGKPSTKTAPAGRPSTDVAGKKAATQTPAVSDPRSVPPKTSSPKPSSLRERRWLVLGSLVAIAALVLGGLLLYKGIQEHRGGGDVASSQRQASAAASAAAETIFSFRYDKLPDHLKDSKAIMTPTFAKEFDKIAPALTELAPQRKIVVEAASRSSAAVDCGSSCSASKATILVFVDQARLVSGSEQPTVFGNRITMSMVKSDGTWLVNDIRAL